MACSSFITKPFLLLVLAIFLGSANASKIRQEPTNTIDGAAGPSNLRGGLLAGNREIHGRGGRPMLIRSVGQRHLQAETTDVADEDTTLADDSEDTEGDTNTTATEGEEESTYEKAKDAAGNLKDEAIEVANTPMSEWTTGQKVGVAIGAFIGFMILVCLLKCLCCR